MQIHSRTNKNLTHILSPQGIVGNLASGKSALVHRYLTGTYVQEESPEGKMTDSFKSTLVLNQGWTKLADKTSSCR